MKKICIITTSLGKGGAERSAAILSQILSGLNYEVHILMTKNDIDYEFSGKLFNLEEKFGSSLSNFKKIKILRSYFKKQSFDSIMDNRPRPNFLKEYVLYNYIFKAKRIISVVHSYNLKNYFPSNKFLVKTLYSKKAAIVTVSKEIESVIKTKYYLSNVTQIYNPVEIELINDQANKEISILEDYILWYGRIEEKVKNLNLLVRAYKASNLADKNIKLLIIGEGEDLKPLKKMITNLKLEENVYHLPFLKTPFPYVKKAKFTVLTSNYEGFPRVLLESLACGTPVVSVNCKSGPSEIIEHEFNGLLVENHKPEILAKAFNTFVDDEKLYKFCKQNAKKSVDKFSIENIKQKWITLLNADA